MSEKIYAWINQGLIATENKQQALEMAEERPSRSGWLYFNRQTMLLLGLLSLAFGVVFFFAYNWNDMSRMVKFGLVQFGLLAVLMLYFFRANNQWLAQSLLLVATLMVGALLALFGQTYQTGADPWQLFATWSVLITPLVLFSRSEVLWLVLAVLLNVALVLFIQINHSFFGLLFYGIKQVWFFLLLNMSLLLLLESISQSLISILKKISLPHRWTAQVLGLSVLFVLTFIGLEGIWGNDKYHGVNVLIYMVLMAAGFAYYRFIRKDLMLLTAWALAVMIFVLSFMGNAIFRHFEAGGLLLMAITLIGMSAFTVKWIKQLHNEFNLEVKS